MADHSEPHAAPSRGRALRRGLVAAALLLAAAAAGLVGWSLRVDLARHVERRVRAEVPPGTPRAEAEAWATRTYGVLPTFHADVTLNRFQGKTVPQMAGVPAEDLGGIVSLAVRRSGPLGRALDGLHYDHVWVYFLLDREQRVAGYFFFSFEELRKLEAARE
jgi:hypothetical protein